MGHLFVLVLMGLGVAVSAGHQACLEYGLNYNGADMSSGTVANVASAEACQRLCQLRAGCQAFTWSAPTDTDCPTCRLKCWLKSSAASPQASKFRVSGPANCQVPERLIFQEEFDSLNETRWQHLVTGWRGGNNEFQYYRNNRKNSYVSNGKLFIKPSFTATEFGSDFLNTGSLNLVSQGCSGDMDEDGGCNIAAGVDIVNPIQSARMRTSVSFSYHYGRLEVLAKMPRGDWLWPAVWLLPQNSVYGYWPVSGEIDLVEVRGNTDFTCGGEGLGNTEMEATLHWGPSEELNGFMQTSWVQVNSTTPYTEAFHKYELEWSDSYLAYKVDDIFIGAVRPPAGGFWQLGGFSGTNVWSSGSRMAPFDQNFHLIINLAIGGDFFPDGCSNGANGAKPWTAGSPTSMRDFWARRADWEKTWGGVGSDQSALQIEYIRVYQRG